MESKVVVTAAAELCATVSVTLLRSWVISLDATLERLARVRFRFEVSSTRASRSLLLSNVLRNGGCFRKLALEIPILRAGPRLALAGIDNVSRVAMPFLVAVVEAFDMLSVRSLYDSGLWERLPDHS